MLDFVSMLTAYEEAAATEAKAKQQQAIVSIGVVSIAIVRPRRSSSRWSSSFAPYSLPTAYYLPPTNY